MKTEDIRNMNFTQLQQELEESYRELFNVRRDLALRKFKNNQRLAAVKKDIARIKTILRERELMVIYGGADAEAAEESTPVTADETPRRRSLLGRGRRGAK